MSNSIELGKNAAKQREMRFNRHRERDRTHWQKQRVSETTAVPACYPLIISMSYLLQFQISCTHTKE